MITSKFPSLPKVPDELPDEQSILEYLTSLRRRMIDELSIIRKSLARADANSQTVAEVYEPDEIVQYSLPKRRIESTGYKVTDFAPADHDILSATHGDTLAAAVAQGSLIYGNATPAWAALAGDNTGTRKYLSCLSNAVSWEGLTITHEMLSATHTDSTTGTVVRGDLITGQGATPKWTRLAKGTQGTLFNMGANEPQWGTTLTTIDATTNVVTNLYTIDHQSSGTPAAGFGSGLLFQLESNTTASQDAAQIAWSWTDATHASRTSKLSFQTVTSAAALAVGAQLAGTVWSVDHIAELTAAHGIVCDNNLTVNTASQPAFYLNEGGVNKASISYTDNGAATDELKYNAPQHHLVAAGADTNGSNSIARIGYYEFQILSIDNAILTHNLYYNGAAWKYRGTGYATAIQSNNGGLIFYTCASGTGGNDASPVGWLQLSQAGVLSAVGGFKADHIGEYTSSHGILLDNSVTINEDGQDCDFRVETDGEANALFVDGGANKVGVSTNAPTVLFSVKELGGVTDEGGYAIKLTAGETISRGNGVYINPAGAASNVYKTPVDGDMCIGVAYADATATNPVWVVVSGKAYVLPTSTVSFALGDVIYSSTTEAGRADSAATVPAITTHMREWGHSLAASSGNGALTLCVLHFN